MGVLTFISMIIIGSVFSAGLLLMFKQKKAAGAAVMLLSVVCYVAYVYIAHTYFV